MVARGLVGGMDWLTFIATMTGHIMWPVVIIVLLVLVRKHIGALAERIEEFSFGGAKFVWRKKLEQGAIIIDQEPKPEVVAPRAQPAPEGEHKLRPLSGDEKRERIARDAARRKEERRQFLYGSSFGRVLSGLDEVDKILFDIADGMGFDPASASSVVYSLAAHGNIPPSIKMLYETLRDARNLIAHTGTLPDERETAEYLRQVQFLQGALSTLRDMMPWKDGQQQVYDMSTE